jgi:signal transduction histidine kinase
MKLMLWVCLTGLLLTLCALALLPERPGSGAQLIEHAQMLDHEGRLLRPVKLQHLEPINDPKSTSRTFRIVLPAQKEQGDMALYVSAAFPSLWIRINGQDIYQDSVSNRENNMLSLQSIRPHLISLPPLAAGQALDLVILGRVGEEVGVHPIWYGTNHSLQEAYQWQYYTKWVGLHVLIAVYVLAAVAALAFWNSDRSYKSPAWFAAFCLAAATAMTMGMATSAPLISWPVHLHITIFIVGLTCVFLTQFILEKLNLRSLGTDRALISLICGFVVIGLLMYQPTVPFPFALVVDIACLILGVILMVSLVVVTLRQPDILNWVLIGGVCVSFLFGLQSVAVGWWRGFDSAAYSLQYAPLPLTLTMGWVVIRRYARMRLRAEALNRRLARRVALREKALHQAYGKVNQLLSQQAVRKERERFMRDMHDGLGAQLIASMRMADRGTLTLDAMRDVLQECLDELRFAIESLKPTADDLLTVLGGYRYRLQPRLEAAGIELRWRADDLGALQFRAEHAVHVLRILNEAVTNALKHTKTTAIEITGQQKEGRYILSVRDEGNGFDHTQPSAHGEGLLSMKQRARQIGAELTVTSDNTGTQISLILAA